MPSHGPHFAEITEGEVSMKTIKCTPMIISEAVSDDAVKELVTAMEQHVGSVSDLSGFSILAEEGGRMVILITDWPSREACLNYHAGRVYRQFVASTHHLLVGDYVVKLFENNTH
jgi:quinol monooxygenase YgiN